MNEKPIFFSTIDQAAQLDALRARIMNEHPILFSGEMVQAILAGRKTQTRRVIKPQPVTNARYDGVDESGFHYAERMNGDTYTEDYLQIGKCPYGQPGDKLWVRESWRLVSVNAEIPGAQFWTVQFADFHVLPHPQPKRDLFLPLVEKDKFSKSITGTEFGKWRPSIFLPRWASRITLGVVNVRVERLHAISGNDAVEEGIKGLCRCGEYEEDHGFGSGHSPVLDDYDAIEGYRSLWNSINGKPKPVYVDKKIVSYECFPWSNEDFDASYPGVRQAGVYRGKPITVTGNPWVWVVEFRKN